VYQLNAASNTRIYGQHHLDEEDVLYLQNNFPNYFYSIDDPYYEGKVIDWGYDFEEGLYHLMKDEKLVLPREKNEGQFKVVFKWRGDPWDPELTRRIKRRFTKRPFPRTNE
jgi:hypothetical protein